MGKTTVASYARAGRRIVELQGIARARWLSGKNAEWWRQAPPVRANLTEQEREEYNRLLVLFSNYHS